MKIIKFFLLFLLPLIGYVSGGKLKFLAFKKPHFGFIGIKVHKPKLLGLKHGLGGGHFLGGHGGAGGFHRSGYERHEYHESHYSGGSFGGGIW